MNISRTNRTAVLVGATFSLAALTAACSARQSEESGSDAPTLRPELSARTDPVGEEVVRRLNAASGGNPPLSYEVVGLPEGLSFSPEDRTISGVPVNAGRYGVVYLVRDVDGDIDYVSFSWNIYAPEPAPTAPPVAEEEVPEVQQAAPVTAPESVAATEPKQPAASHAPPTYVVAIGGSAERMPACKNFQAIIALGHAGATGNTSAFTQMFSVGDCLWLNEGDEVAVPDPDNTAVAMGRIGDSERAISVAQVSTDDGLKWFPAELLREAR